MFCSVQCILKFALPAAISGAGFLHTARNCLSKAYMFYHILTQKPIIYFIINTVYRFEPTFKAQKQSSLRQKPEGAV